MEKQLLAKKTDLHGGQLHQVGAVEVHSLPEVLRLVELLPGDVGPLGREAHVQDAGLHVSVVLQNNVRIATRRARAHASAFTVMIIRL